MVVLVGSYGYFFQAKLVEVVTIGFFYVRKVIQVLKNGLEISKIDANPPEMFGERFSANLSRADQTITITVLNMQFQEDGIKFVSKLHILKNGVYVPVPYVTTVVQVVGKFVSLIDYRNHI